MRACERCGGGIDTGARGSITKDPAGVTVSRLSEQQILAHLRGNAKYLAPPLVDAIQKVLLTVCLLASSAPDGEVGRWVDQGTRRQRLAQWLRDQGGAPGPDQGGAPGPEGAGGERVSVDSVGATLRALFKDIQSIEEFAKEISPSLLTYPSPSEDFVLGRDFPGDTTIYECTQAISDIMEMDAEQLGADSIANLSWNAGVIAACIELLKGCLDTSTAI